MEISIVHPSLNRAGGAERYCLEMLDTLVKNGYEVSLYTIDNTDWEMIQRIHNLSTRTRREEYLQSNPVEPDGIISWIRTALAYTWLLIRATEETDICINNYGEIMPFFAQVSVIHSVPMSSITENSYRIPLWGFMRRAYLTIFQYLEEKHGSNMIITNSRYNAEKINDRTVEIRGVDADDPGREHLPRLCHGGGANRAEDEMNGRYSRRPHANRIRRSEPCSAT